ncbi:glucosyl-3-phosphoglycerate synthase [Haloechinothrix sp. YIM 98757]|uniref:Glucosyl-3-phosphoglycerate synthase n=1 Tax=Haloechinothrix aidingensis TaxID=2752311 RepID=A0A838AFG6_9PSEU|nr:glucosyl-3-phosphoglycerate synthase [Haloechinothrix aidingensis]MBA0128003.1 glucosyl-3-phosphoglycerate synthase [Haloechinothrix aidingensis]
MDGSLSRTYQTQPWTRRELERAKGETTVSVVLPALNEEDTVAGVVESVRPLVGGLVDEVVVVDSGSTDATPERARDAGARVERCRDILPELEPVPGKGEVLWRSLAATTGDVLVFLDSDLVEPDPAFVPGLLGPLLCDSGVHLVKGFYRRPLRVESEEWDTGGGRVTELLARPVLDAFRPALSGLIQPLGGEYAATRSLLESVPFATGYGVEIGLLLDTEQRYGADALAQVNLGVRKHRNRSLLQLGVMARQILGTVLSRCRPDPGPGTSTGTSAETGTASSGTVLTQFVQVAGEWLPTSTEVSVGDRPPMNTLRVRSTSGVPSGP